MGTIIKATGISTNKNNKSSVEHAAEAGRNCVEASGVSTRDIDILINVGVYRDENIGEPAMAALIQKGIGIKCDYTKGQPEMPTFSVDLMNGSCALLNAVQVIDALLRTKQIKYAMIVSSDSHPSKKEVEGFPFSCIGGAMLLEYIPDDDRGFKNIIFRNTKTIDTSIKGFIDLSKTDEAKATERITVEQPEQYLSEVLKLASDTAKEYISSAKIDPAHLKLIAPQIYEGFGKKVAASAGISENSILDLYKEYGDSHSSALTMAYHLGNEKGLYKSKDEILFVAAGAGISSACGLYKF